VSVDEWRLLTLAALVSVMFVALWAGSDPAVLLVLPWILLMLMGITLAFGGLIGLGCVLPIAVLAYLDKRVGRREGVSRPLVLLIGSLFLLGLAAVISDLGWQRL